MVFLGHVGGILIPETWTAALGISETAYHAVAATLGILAGVSTLAGVAILIYRRRTTTAVFTNTSVAPFRGETCDTIGGIRFGSRGLVRA